MAMLKKRKLILALIDKLPEMAYLTRRAVNKPNAIMDKLFTELQGLYGRLDLYNFIINKHIRKVGI